MPENGHGEGKTPTAIKLFDWGVYGGIAGVGVFLGTIPIAYWAKYGGGAPWFKKASKWLTGFGMSEHTADQVVMTTALMQGGNIGILAVKGAENYKPEITCAIGDAIGEPVDKRSIDRGPKQTWGSLIKSRIFLAWTPVFLSFKGAASVIGEERFAAFEDGFSKHVVCGPLGKPTHINGQETKLFRTGKIAALDLFATAAAAALLYVGTRIWGITDKKDAPGKGGAIGQELAKAQAAPVGAEVRENKAAVVSANDMPNIPSPESRLTSIAPNHAASQVEMQTAG